MFIKIQCYSIGITEITEKDRHIYCVRKK